MAAPITFSLSYSGGLSDEHRIDFYDISQALVGFQRSLALTTHIVLNGAVITQAPALKGAKIWAQIPEGGSWKIAATITLIGTGIYNLGTAPADTPVGNLIRSAYDYVVSETLGFHVDYHKTLGEQYDELKRRKTSLPKLEQPKLDSVIEKCDVAIRDMHRPIVWSETASQANVLGRVGRSETVVGPALTPETFDYIQYSSRSDTTFSVIGRVSSYNVNTFKGRIYVLEEQRPIPFELASSARNANSISLVTESLRLNARTRAQGDILCQTYRITSRTGRTKALEIVKVSAVSN